MASSAQKNISDWSLVIMCPMANEKDTAEGVVREFLAAAAGFRKVRFLAILDNACKDGTVDLLRKMSEHEPRLHVVWAPENRGQVDAYIRGYKEALTLEDVDWILEADAGFSHRPEDLKNFYPAMMNGADAVFATRFGKGGQMKNCTLRHRVISQGGTWLSNILLGTGLTDMTSGYQMFSRATLDYIMKRGIQSRGHFFQTEIKTYCHKFKVGEAPITYMGSSGTISNGMLSDAFRHLGRLFGLRITGKLYA